MAGTYGIYGFHYSEIAKQKLHVRNQLLLFQRYAGENETLLIDSDALARLFLISADNIGGEFYTEEDLAVIDPIMDTFLSGGFFSRELSMEDVRIFLDLAMKRRFTLERNEPLAMKLAQEYNEHQGNELLLIDMDVFRFVCRDLDG